MKDGYHWIESTIDVRVSSKTWVRLWFEEDTVMESVLRAPDKLIERIHAIWREEEIRESVNASIIPEKIKKLAEIPKVTAVQVISENAVGDVRRGAMVYTVPFSAEERT